MPYIIANVVIFVNITPFKVIAMKVLVKPLNHVLNIESKRNYAFILLRGIITREEDGHN